MIINYIDFRKAFNSIHRSSLWNILSIYGVPQKYMNIFKALYTDSSCCVKSETGVTDFVTILSGVQQQYILSPLFFLILLDLLMQKAIDTGEARIKWESTDRLPDLAFEDDLALLANNSIQLQQMTDCPKSNAQKVSLCINTSSTNIQRIGNWSNNTAAVTVDEKLLVKVQRFQHLDSYQTSDCNIEVDIKSKIGKGSAVFKQLQSVWSSKSFTLKTKPYLFMTIAVSITTYAMDTWKCKAKSIQQLDIFQHYCLRNIMNIKWQDRVTSK